MNRFKISFFVIFAVLFFVCIGAKRPMAFDYQVGSSSYFFFSKDRNVNGANRTYIPYYQYLNLDITQFATPSLSIHVSGWGRGDITSHDGNRGGDGDLLYGYLQWQDKSEPSRVLRVGRQFFFGGPTSLRSQYVDGLYFKTNIIKGFGVEILGGSQITSSIDGRGGDIVAQGRLYHIWKDKVEIGAGYLNARDSNERSTENVGIDFWLAPFSKTEFFGYSYFDIIAKEFVDANVTATVYPSKKVKITGDVSYTVPSNLLPHTSLFSVFSTSSYERLGVAGTYFISDRFTLDGDAQFFNYSDGSQVFRFGSQGSYKYGAEKQGSVALGLHRLDQLEGGVTELRVYNNYRFSNKIALSLDIYGYIYDTAIRNRDFSFTTIGSTSYEIVKNLQLLGSLFYSDNPYFDNEFRGLLRIVYSFGGKTSVF